MYDFSKLLWKTEKEVSDEAFKYIKSHKKDLIKRFVGSKKSVSKDKTMMAIFMAGSPGAGKTEVSKSMIESFSEGSHDFGGQFVRIDPDEIRSFIPDNLYAGDNSYMVQRAASKGAHILFDYVSSKRFNFILDGTFSNKKNAIKNIEKLSSTSKNAFIDIFFIYQEPEIAWEWTKKREQLEGRNIRKEDFVDKLFLSIENVNFIKERFKEKVRLHVVIKNISHDGVKKVHINVPSVDSHLKIGYNKKGLLDILK